MGNWITTSAFYRAEYRICKEKGQVVGRIMSYDDGTTSFSDNKLKKPRYVFKSLEHKDSCFVDGTSGASQKVSELVIKSKGTDSLEVTSMVMNRPISEIWVRKNLVSTNNNE